MNPNFDTPVLMTRICVIAAVLAGVFAATSIVANQAGAASSGGIGSTPDEPEAGEESGASGSKAGKYSRLWSKVSKRDRRWARKTAECESGKNPKAIGGGGQYRGAFQFLKSTWKASPKSPGGDPIRYRYRTQAVVAVALKRNDGAHHWPVCG